MNKKKTLFTTLILLIMPLCCSLAQSAAVDYPMNYSMEFTRCFGMPGLNLSWGFDKPYEEARILVNDFNVNKNSDFDFNDLVFDAKFTSLGARLTVWAVGTTSPIKVGGREAHELFGVSTSTLVNTKDMTHNAITFDIEGDYAGDFNNIEVEMQDENGDWHLLQSRRGDATTKLAVPTSVKWCMENENISKVYPDFSNYVFGYECNWWENYQGSQIAVETKRTIHVAQAGTLSSYISEEEKCQIEELTLTGEINGTDFKTIRRMLGAPSELDSQYYNYGYGWGNEDTKLRSLDISGARIVAGGTYIENHQDAACDLHLNESDIIPARVFDGCKNLVSIAIPDDVNFIGSFALRGTAWYDAQPDGLVYLGKVLYTYKGNDIPSKITIEDGTLGIAGDAFADQSIESVTIPESVTRIGDGEFYFGGDTTPGFRPLGKGAFEGCTRLKDVYCYAENVPDTKMNPFWGTDIESGILYVPAGSIDAYKAAEPWSNFKEILPIEGSGSSGSCGENLTWKYDEATKALTISGTGEMDSYTLIGSPWYELRKSIQSLVIEDGVTTIGNCAFAWCDGMTSVTIPNSITSIGSSAFWQSGITSFVINNNISRIEQSTFYGCHNLETLVIGRNVSFIGDGNFIFCGLKDIYCYAEDVPWAEKAFEGVEVDGSPDDITLHVAANSIKDYQSSYPWSNFKEILPIEGSGNDDPMTVSQIVGKWEFLWATPFSSYTMTQLEFRSDGTFSYTSTDKPDYEEHGVYKIEGDILYHLFSDEDDWELSRIKSVDSNYLKLTDLSDDGLTERRELLFLKDNIDEYGLTLTGTWLGGYPDGASNRYEQWIFNSDGTGSLSEWHDDSDKTSVETFTYRVSGSSIAIDWGDGSPEIYDYSISGVSLILSRYEQSKEYYWLGEITGIRSIRSDIKIDGIYSLNGTKQSSPSKGINIIKMKDGTIKKVLIK